MLEIPKSQNESKTKSKSKNRRITFYNADKERRYMRLGNVDKRTANSVKAYIEKIVAAKRCGGSLAPEVVNWIASLPNDFYSRLAEFGILPPRKQIGTLKELIPRIIEKRAATVSTQTIEIWRQAERSLYEHFGEDRKVDTITRNDAEEYRSWLVSNGRLDGKGGLKPTTVWKRLQYAMYFFRAMALNDDIVKSPFVKMSMEPAVDETRNEYIKEDFIKQVMEVASDAEWKAIMALWRFGGLRGSSEPLLVRWQDINWENNTILVHSQKVKRHPGKGVRTIPLFPELLLPLREAQREAGEKDIYVITKHAPKYLKGVVDRRKLEKIKANLGSIFAGFVERAGLKPWPKIINNIRASWITDLLDGKYQTVEKRFGIQTIAYWAGNSPKVILQAYARVRKEEYHQVTQFNAELLAESLKMAQNDMVPDESVWPNFSDDWS